MVRREKEKFVDLGRVESEKYEPTKEVREQFDEAAQLAGRGQPLSSVDESQSPSADALYDDIAEGADLDVREATPGVGLPLQEESEVEEIGKAVGLTYQYDEPLHTTEKVEDRDRHRWELDPASSEGFEERMKREGSVEEK